jgi:GLPGLI family protein
MIVSCSENQTTNSSVSVNYRYTNSLFPNPSEDNTMQVLSKNDNVISLIYSDALPGVDSKGIGAFLKSDSLPFYINKDYKSKKIFVKDRSAKPEYMFEVAYDFYTQDLSQKRWEMTDEYKDLNGRKCQLAFIEYSSGCKFYCLFDSSSKYKIMPWKFPEINGLVVKVYSEDEVITFSLIEDSINELEGIDNYLINKDDTLGLEVLTYEERITYCENSLEAAYTKMSKNLPIDSKLEKPTIDFYCN